MTTGNYLRVRGEYHFSIWATGMIWELPPRARRIQNGGQATSLMIGTTSACAENTTKLYAPRLPHVELPPRARRIRLNASLWGWLMGTTSACAENTAQSPGGICGHRNYLRVRGEYRGVAFQMKRFEELPPRARRIPLLDITRQKWYGTTSACAENTLICLYRAIKYGNYLRVRGEYVLSAPCMILRLELPPRARRIHIEKGTGAWGTGTTSACAENTGVWVDLVDHGRNYLRVRGEYRLWRPALGWIRELPPRARRIPAAQT